MSDQQPLDYETSCKLVGQLFLESRFELERISRNAAETVHALKEKLSQVERERDEAVRALLNRPG